MTPVDVWRTLLALPGRVAALLTPQRLRHGVKTALAVALCQAVAVALDLEHGYWAVITAILVMQMDLGNSLKVAGNRFIGTLAGAGAALAVGLLAPPGFAWREAGMLLAVGLAACLAQVHESFRMAAITTAVALYGWSGQESLVVFSLARVGSILLGVVGGMAVSFLVWPARASGLLKEALGRELSAMAEALSATAAHFLGQGPEADHQRMAALNGMLARNRDLWQSARREPVLLGRAMDLMPLIRGLDRLFVELRVMRQASRVRGDEPYRQTLSGEVLGLTLAASTLMGHLAALLRGADKDQALATLAALELHQALGRLEARFNELRGQDATKSHPLESIMASFSFCQSLKNLAAHILDMAEALGLGTREA